MNALMSNYSSRRRIRAHRVMPLDAESRSSILGFTWLHRPPLAFAHRPFIARWN